MKPMIFVIMILFSMAGCSSAQISKEEISVGVLNYLYWNDPPIKDGTSASEYLSNNKTIMVEVYELESDKRGVFVKLGLPTERDAVLVFYKNGKKNEYGYYSEGETLLNKKLIMKVPIEGKRLLMRNYEKTLQFMEKPRAIDLVKKWFPTRTNGRFYVGPISDAQAFLNVYDESRDLVWAVPISPAVFEEQGRHNLYLSCPVEKRVKPRDASLPEMARTKGNLIKRGTKVVLQR